MTITVNGTLSAIQKELKAPKNQHNSFGNYNYRSCEDILEAVKPILNKLGCCLTISDEIVAVGDRFYVKATATLSMEEGSVSTSAFAREPLSKKGMDESQITGATSSYARKYALNGLFAIDDNKDADTMDNRPVKEKPQAKPITEEAVNKCFDFVKTASTLDDKTKARTREVIQFLKEKNRNEEAEALENALKTK